MNTLFCSMFAFLSLASCNFSNNIAGNEFQLISPKYPIEITLGFDKKGRYFGGALNRYFGTYKVKGDTVSFSRMASTKMAGAPDDMKAEDEYFNTLKENMKYEFKENELILKNVNGKELIYKNKGRINENK